MYKKNILNKFFKIALPSICLCLLFICTIIIFIHGTINWDSKGVVRSTWSPKRLAFISLCGISALVSGICLFYHFVLKLSLYYRRIIYISAITISVLFQLFLIFHYQILMGWDNTDTLVSAISLVTGENNLFSFDYFEIYQNQRCFLLFTTLIVWIAHSFGISYSTMPVLLGLVSMICIDLSMLVSYFIIKEIKGANLAEKSIIWFLINQGIYLWCAYYYTTNVSLLFISLAIYLFIKSWKYKKNCLFYVFFGMFLLFGIQFRATLIIVVIGALLMGLIKRPPNALKGSLLIASGMLIMQLLLQSLFSFFIPSKETDQAFPVSHWLMMGAQGVGAYNDQDVFFTASFPTKEERDRADWNLYIERIKELGIKGNIQLAIRKMTYNWSYGNHAYEPEFQYYDALYDLLWGTKNKVMLAYEQIYHLSLLLFVVWGIVLNWRKCINGNMGMMFLLYVVFWGGILFYIFWETNPYYSVGFLTIFILCSMEGMDVLTEQVKMMTEKMKKCHVLLIKICLDIVFVSILLNSVFDKDKDFYKETRIPVVTQSKICDVLFFNGDNTITQDFVANRPFNTVEIWLTKTKRKEDSCGIYQISLSGEKSGLIFQETIYNQDVFRTISYIKHFQMIEIDDKERFELTVQTIKDDPNNRMGICYYNQPVDRYLKGGIFMDEEIVQGDMMINVYISEEE